MFAKNAGSAHCRSSHRSSSIVCRWWMYAAWKRCTRNTTTAAAHSITDDSNTNETTRSPSRVRLCLRCDGEYMALRRAARV
eukprot:2851406-Rhodomonas_salina.2